MGPLDYLRGIKRRRRAIAGIVAATVALALLSTLVYSVQRGHPLQLARAKVAQFETTTTTGSTAGKPVGSTASPASPLTVIASLVTLDDVALRAAKDLSYRGQLSALTGKISATVDHTSGLLFITAKATDPAAAIRRANAFATELINYIRDRDTQANDAQARELQSQMARVRGDISALDRQLARYHVAPAAQSTSNKGPSSATEGTTGSPADPLIAERNAALTQLGALSQDYQATRSRVSDAEGLSIFQSAQPAGVVKPRLPLPRSLPFRIFLGLLLGLLAGLAYSVLRDKFSRVVRTRDSVEDTFGYPVLVEIPEMPGRRKGGEKPDLASLPPRVADGFRLLAASLGIETTQAAANELTVTRRRRVIAVTSAGPREGKTTVVANLAAALSEVGKTVVMFSADFRHPRLHREFGASNESGLAEILRAHMDEQSDGPILNGCVWYTSLKGVWLLPSGNAVESPDQLLASAAMRRAVAEARERADIVLIDTSPILTSDIAYLLPVVDSVLLISKAGLTSPDLAERSSELLQRLGAPVLGVALIADSATALPADYYRTNRLKKLVATVPTRAHAALGTAPAPKASKTQRLRGFVRR